MKNTFWMILLVISIGLISCSKKEEQNNNTQQKDDTTKPQYLGNTALVKEVKGTLTETETPQFSWLNEKNEEIKLSDYKGKVILVNFWATWCGPCKKEIPDFVNIYHKYKSSGLEVLGISLDSELSLEELAQFVGENDINYQIIMDNGNLQNAFGGIQAIPTTFLIGKDFKVKDHAVGAMNEQQLEDFIKKEL